MVDKSNIETLGSLGYDVVVGSGIVGRGGGGGGLSTPSAGFGSNFGNSACSKLG
jgi:hypothetical protein